MSHRYSTLFLILLIIASATFALLRFDSLQVGTSYDDAHYIILAESLASGQGYMAALHGVVFSLLTMGSGLIYARAGEGVYFAMAAVALAGGAVMAAARGRLERVASATDSATDLAADQPQSAAAGGSTVLPS